MKKYLLALFVMISTSFMANAGSPEKCKETLDVVLAKLKNQGAPLTGDHFWTLPDAEICEFKRHAHAAGLWAQFAQVCNSLTQEECRVCKCGRDDFTNATACSLKCGHCWSTGGPCFQNQ